LKIKKVQKFKRNQRKDLTESVRALRKLRELKKLSRSQAGELLGISGKTIESIENGRVEMTSSRIEHFITIYGVTFSDFEEVKINFPEAKIVKPISRFREKKVLTNLERRSYQKKITKEVRVLKILRKYKKLSQYKANEVCGYKAKATIGHIENGRIEISTERIRHIVQSYGLKMDDFNDLMSSEVLRDEVLEKCISIIEKLPEQKLQVVQPKSANNFLIFRQIGDESHLEKPRDEVIGP